MNRKKFIKIVGKGSAVGMLLTSSSYYSLTHAFNQSINNKRKLRVSGIYPHLAVFNQNKNGSSTANGGECGIGAVVPWASKLWLITYSPHAPEGSNDKLYSIDSDLNIEISPESVGGTPADRMIHKKSNQLIIGPYFISEIGKVRALSPKNIFGRWTAVAEHLKNPLDKVYFIGMEGKIYEINVHSLKHKLLYKKPVPGWHGKGGYTAQGRLIISNNANEESDTFELDPNQLEIGGLPQNVEQAGILAEWDGENWSIIRRRQFTEVTGPGGIYGTPNDEAPAWSLGWDKRSVILMLLDNGKWTEFRLPKSTHTYDSKNGWYTEWPRIREVTNKKWLMDMHGMLYNFPSSFSSKNVRGIKPLNNHLLMITDFCAWNNKIVLGTDVTSMMKNKLAGQSQSNLWFGSHKDLVEWGPINGWGGVWQEDKIEAGLSSSPFLISGFKKKTLHLSHQSERKITFTLEVNKNGRWENYKNISIEPKGYRYYIFPKNFEAEWIRIKSDQDCIATAFFHYFERGHNAEDNAELFKNITDIKDSGNDAGIIRPAGHNRSLQYLDYSEGKENAYYEIDKTLQFKKPVHNRSDEVEKIANISKDFRIDDASVIVKDHSGIFRLPKTNARYDHPFETGWPRGKREVITERSLLNVHGTIYEIANQTGLATMRPICTHNKKIFDFCSWRGLLVVSGTKGDRTKDGHYFSSSKSSAGLWFGAVDDLWKLGQPTGSGGPWKNTQIKANEYSLPYLMTGYDKKRVRLSADRDVTITLEVDFDHNGWHKFKSFRLKNGESVKYDFPEGYSAHWVRAKSDNDCKATVQFIYS